MPFPQRLLGLVLQPAVAGEHVDARHEAVTPPLVSRVAVLAPDRDLLAVSCATALALPGAVVGVVATSRQSGEPPVPAGALGRTRRLASRLQAVDFEAVAAGRLVRVGLPDDDLDAARESRRLSACCEFPIVFGVGGPRGEEMSAVLRQVDRVVIARTPGLPDGLLALAREEFAGAVVIDVRLGAPLRSGFSLGYGVSPRLTRDLRGALA